MKKKQLVQTIFVSFVMVMTFISFSIENNNPIISKKGSMDYKKLWTEQDVKTFLKLPYSLEQAVVSRIKLEKFYGMPGIANFANISTKGVTILKPNDNSLGGVSFKLCDHRLHTFSVSLYNPTSCRNFCDSIFKYTTNSLPMWSEFPDVYEPHIENGIYTLLTKGAHPQKLYFDTKRLFVIQVSDDRSQLHSVRTEDNNKTLETIDEIIKSIVEFIEDDKAERINPKDDYNIILEKYKKSAQSPFSQ